MSSATGEAHKLPSSTSAQSCFRFSLIEIQSATKDFDKELIIGEGGFGKVYKGCICIEETSHVVAIKRLDSKSEQGAPEFSAEIKMLPRLRHCHLVSLIGFCDDNKEMILVYAYMPNRTLYYHLHKAETPLNWMQRLKIALGAGRGLDYLHTGVGTQEGVIHRDVKSSNILLDENWAAKISDFGLSEIGPTNQSSSYVDVTVKGTFGYLDPEYFYTQKLTRKTDVYAFGVVLFELLSGRLAVDKRNDLDHCSLVRWAQRCVKERNFDQMVDSNIRGTISPNCLRRFAQTADRCVHRTPKKRPSMTEVVASLQVLLELQKKSDDSTESSSITRLTWKIHKYLVFTTKQNSDQSGTSSPKSLEKNMFHDEMPRQHGELVAKLKKFTYDELSRATGDFGNGTRLGDGTYAVVYKGFVNRKTYFPFMKYAGLPIAVKRLHRYKRSTISKLDLEMLIEFSHPNLVKLIGYCLEQREIFLVYEFMHNGNFQDHLHSGAITRLPLITRVKIAVGIARGIVFLQNTQNQVGVDPPRIGIVSESRLDRHNILLDKQFTAKLSGYDVSKLVHGGYPRECYSAIFRASVNTEIGDSYPEFHPSPLRNNLWGFTVVFAEVLTGKIISNEIEFQKIDKLLHGTMSLVDIAYKCFQICNGVDSESEMLQIVEQYIPACQNEDFTTKTFQSYLPDCLGHGGREHLAQVICLDQWIQKQTRFQN